MEKTGKQFVDRYLKPVSLEANIFSFSGSRRPYNFTTNESVDIRIDKCSVFKQNLDDELEQDYELATVVLNTLDSMISFIMATTAYIDDMLDKTLRRKTKFEAQAESVYGPNWTQRSHVVWIIYLAF